MQENATYWMLQIHVHGRCHRQTDMQIDRWTNRQTDRRTDKETERQKQKQRSYRRKGYGGKLHLPGDRNKDGCATRGGSCQNL